MYCEGKNKAVIFQVMERFVPIKKFVEDKRLAFGEVYVPDVIDTQGDFMTAEVIEQMAYQFLASGKVNKIDTDHDLKENGTVVVESFIARPGDPDFQEGAWVMAVHVIDEELWKDVKEGKINGFSMYGKAKRVEKTVIIEIPDDGTLSGETSVDGKKAPHSHNYTIQFDTSGKVAGGWTNSVDGHTHRISSESVTEQSAEHSHRFNILDVASVSR